MGATTFSQLTQGPTAQAAFDAAREQAQYDHGHSGYTGTIAEKREFVLMATAKSSEEAQSMADFFIKSRDKRIDSKWGPAGCIEIEGTKQYLFFGWASE